MLPEHRVLLEDEPCPVPDEILGEMYRASAHGLNELIATVSPTARVLLAGPPDHCHCRLQGRSPDAWPVFISSLTYTRARGARRGGGALADGRTMVAGAGDGAASYGVIANRSPNSAH